MKEPAALLVINRKDSSIAEMTQSWMGLVIWRMEFTKIPKNTLCVYPYVVYDDDEKFKDYDVIGEI